ncbi:helix-turn-helix domain-containing protein [Xanthomonas translucens]|uniref:helix-turn-helix domain-containing protein n=1 Tax=Xanthomonas campestris pv. translucens TaxID=343 RepID=UPI000A55433F|nr:helix-turn-helix transcriptional regulator [Xanthomonas translucens]MCT8281731.1 helix-turn-helix transcriptional regulator [Xanthomonas translucens pv. undulosa]MCT8316515.1 helix-turn-helix transcriptional regulator [Xanthomonas translucens pv. undulosa]UKE38251.1 helix-turn-helix transcriptional regulator [Xanthomonas translucens pv. undulosa]
MTTIETTMYTLGQIARAVYPQGDIPNAILDTLLTRPAAGLGMLADAAPAHAMRRTPDKHGDYDKLVGSLPADLTNGPIPVTNQGPFWTGWYHYMTALDRSKKWGPEQLARAGTLLFGDRWQSDLARALGVDDRRVRQWLSGDRKPPAGVWADIAGLLRQRQQEGLALLREMDAAD